MSIIKQQREKLGYTQINLSKVTGLSIRTIQRLEASNKEPKGHTLKVLSEVFDMEPPVFQEQFLSTQEDESSDILSIKMINLSVLAIFGIPFGNLIVPIYLWNKKRQSKIVDEVGRKIINIQISWTLMLSFLLCISTFIDQSPPGSFPLILIILFSALAMNIAIVGYTAFQIQRNDFELPIAPVRFL